MQPPRQAMMPRTSTGGFFTRGPASHGNVYKHSTGVNSAHSSLGSGQCPWGALVALAIPWDALGGSQRDPGLTWGSLGKGVPADLREGTLEGQPASYQGSGAQGPP